MSAHRLLVIHGVEDYNRYIVTDFPLIDDRKCANDVSLESLGSPALPNVRLGELGEKFCRQILEIPGVDKVKISRFQVTVYRRSMLFPWSRIESSVFSALREIYGKIIIKREKVVVRMALWFRRNILWPLGVIK